MSDRAEALAHFVGGALLALFDLALVALVPGPVPIAVWAVLAVWHATLLGNVREQEQARKSGGRYRPSAFWRWSAHRLGEWLAWPAGAALSVLGVVALSR